MIDIDSYDIISFKENMFTPIYATCWPYITFACSVLVFPSTGYLNHWCHSVTKTLDCKNFSKYFTLFLL